MPAVGIVQGEVDRYPRIGREILDRVRAAAAIDLVAAGAALERVVAGAAIEHVIAAAAPECIVATAAGMRLSLPRRPDRWLAALSPSSTSFW